MVKTGYSKWIWGKESEKNILCLTYHFPVDKPPPIYQTFIWLGGCHLGFGSTELNIFSGEYGVKLWFTKYFRLPK